MVWPLSARILAVALVATGASAWAGCSSGDGGKTDSPANASEVDFATDGSETASAETDAQLITSSLVSSSTPDALGLASQPGGDLETLGFGDGARALYFPQKCLQVTNDDASKTATYTFSHCTGPNGLRDVTGVLRAHYTLAAKELHLELAATKFAVNKASLDWTATADVSANGAARSMSWKATLSGVSGGGRKLARTTEHTIGWQLGEACFDVDGASEGSVNDHHIKTVIEAFRRCRRSCPDSGGKIIVTNVDTSESFELRYDGTNRATLVGPQGNDVSIPLLCAP